MDWFDPKLMQRLWELCAMAGSMAMVRLIVVLLIILVPSCLLAETYMWTDEDGNTIVSNEKPPEHIKDFQTIGQRDA